MVLYTPTCPSSAPKARRPSLLGCHLTYISHKNRGLCSFLQCSEEWDEKKSYWWVGKGWENGVSAALQTSSSVWYGGSPQAITVWCALLWPDPTNFFYKLANQDTRIWLKVTPPCKVQQASDATTNCWKHMQVLYFMNKEEDILAYLWKNLVGWPW